MSVSGSITRRIGRRDNDASPTSTVRIGCAATIPDKIEAVQSILDRSCRNCHSNQTVWPWYSHVAPVSWNVIWHVNDGRGSMNMSDWPAGPEEAADLLDGICDEVKKGKMPMP